MVQPDASIAQAMSAEESHRPTRRASVRIGLPRASALLVGIIGKVSSAYREIKQHLSESREIANQCRFRLLVNLLHIQRLTKPVLSS
jgi:hypothetical protein